MERRRDGDGGQSEFPSISYRPRPLLRRRRRRVGAVVLLVVVDCIDLRARASVRRSVRPYLSLAILLSGDDLFLFPAQVANQPTSDAASAFIVPQTLAHPLPSMCTAAAWAS